MKAIQFTETGGPEVLQFVDLPDPTPGPGELLVKVESAAVNFSDVTRRKGNPYPDPTPLPFVPGAEIAGTVVALGEGIEEPALGTAVFGVAGTGEGGYAELATMYAQNAIPRPESMSADSTAGLIVVGLSAALIVTQVGKVAKGETVFVPAAAGGLGSYAVQIAKLLGATVIAGASTEEKRQIALGYGADYAIAYSGKSWVEAVRDLTDGRGVDVALEMTDPAHLAQTISTLAPFGRLVVYGAAGDPSAAVDTAPVHSVLYDPAEGQSLTGFNLGKWLQHRLPETLGTMQQLIGWAAGGDLAGPAISTLTLDRAAEAQTLLETGANKGKIILKP